MTLLRPRWVAGHLLVLALTVSFILLGFWQLGRDHHKQALVRQAKAAYSAPAPDVAGSQPLPVGSRAQASGTYDTAHEVLWTNQVHNGTNGDDLLTPLRLADGTAVLVDRGWVAIVGGNAPVATVAATGPVTVNGLVNTSSALSSLDTSETIAGNSRCPASTWPASARPCPTNSSRCGSSRRLRVRRPGNTLPCSRNPRRPTR